MEKTKFTVRVDREAFEAAKQYAGHHDTTVTRKVDQIIQDTPVLNELAGSLRMGTTLEDYHAYLEKKYLDDAKLNS